MKNQIGKLFFGIIIFLFSVALAYSTANYLSSSDLFDYWGTITLFAGLYLLIGILVSKIFTISLGFLFGADVLILHFMAEYYGKWDNILKMSIVGTVLVVVYIFAAIWLKDEPSEEPLPSSQ